MNFKTEIASRLFPLLNKDEAEIESINKYLHDKDMLPGKIKRDEIALLLINLIDEQQNTDNDAIDGIADGIDSAIFYLTKIQKELNR